MKKIALDISYYWKMSGYWVVTNNLLKKMLEKDNDNYFYLISNERKDLKELNHLNNREFVCTDSSFIFHKFLRLPRYLKKYNIDTYFSFDQELPLIKVCKYVCIFHDIWALVLWKKNIIKQLFTRWTNKLDRIYHLLWFEKRAARKADYVFCPSKNTKKDLIKMFWIKENKIEVIYRWIDHFWVHEKIDKNQKDNYILIPFSNLYDDFQYELANKIIENKIVDKVIFLRPAYIDNEVQLEKNIEIIKSRIPQDKLENYYKKSLLSIYLSDYDWFWFVPLESVCFWTPVLCNKTSCIPEIMWNLWIIENLWIQDYINKIMELLWNKSLYNNLLQQQTNNNSKYKRDNIIPNILKSF